MKCGTGLFFLTGLLAVAMLFGTGSKADWPQWQGATRDSISPETGLLKSWPGDGPKVLWRIPVGEGYSGISISKGLLYTMHAPGDDEFVICLDASNGKEIWRSRTDAKYHNGDGNGPRSMPTVDGDWVFALGAKGVLHALYRFLINTLLIIYSLAEATEVATTGKTH